MNFFSSPQFLDAAADAFFRGRRHGVEEVAVDDEVYRFLVVRRGTGWPRRPITRLPFLDYLEPTGAKPRRGLRKTAYLPRVSLGTATKQHFDDEDLRARYFPSPYIRWNRFTSHDDFVAACQVTNPASFKSSPRKWRKLSREIGEARFVYRDDNPAALAQAMEWKSAQYQRSNLPDLFQDPAIRRLFFALNERGALVVSSLYAGSALTAVHLGASHAGRFYYWVPAYDPALAGFSPGTLLLEGMMQGSYDERDGVFDFLLGDEPYKWTYATDTMLVSSKGTPPLSQRVYEPIRDALVEKIQSQDAIYRRLQMLKRKALERGFLR